MAAAGALGEARVFLNPFGSLPDPRPRGTVVYPRDAVRLLCRLAVLAGAERVVAIARFGPKTRALVHRFRPFTEATPSHDQRGARVAALDAQTFQPCFVSWGAVSPARPPR